MPSNWLNVGSFWSFSVENEYLVAAAWWVAAGWPAAARAGEARKSAPAMEPDASAATPARARPGTRAARRARPEPPRAVECSGVFGRYMTYFLLCEESGQVEGPADGTRPARPARAVESRPRLPRLPLASSAGPGVTRVQACQARWGAASPPGFATAAPVPLACAIPARRPRGVTVTVTPLQGQQVHNCDCRAGAAARHGGG